MRTETTWIVNIYWLNREIQTVYVGAENESQAKMKAVRDACNDVSELYDHTKTTAVRIDAL